MLQHPPSAICRMWDAGDAVDGLEALHLAAHRRHVQPECVREPTHLPRLVGEERHHVECRQVEVVAGHFRQQLGQLGLAVTTDDECERPGKRRDELVGVSAGVALLDLSVAVMSDWSVCRGGDPDRTGSTRRPSTYNNA